MSGWVLVLRQGRRRTVLAYVPDVPAEVKLAEVREAVEGWPRWDAWQRRVGLGGSLAVQRAVTVGQEALGTAEVVSWAALSPETWQLTTRVPGSLRGPVRRAAAARGQTVAAFVADAITTAVDEVAS